MPNILQEYNATSEQRIDDKTEIYSVTTSDVGETIREGVELGAIITTTIVGKTYPKGWRAIDGSFNLYIAKLDNVSDDVTNTTNWRNVSSGSATEPYKLEIECDGVQEVYPVPHNTNNDAPVGVLYVEDAFGDWQPLDWTQGIKATSPDILSFNTMAYLGNAFGIKYKITVACVDFNISGSFDPYTDTIGNITPVNSAIVDNDTINDFASKTQGQIDALASATGIVRLVEDRAGVTVALGATVATDYVENCTGTNTLTLPTAVGNTNKYTVTIVSGSTTINTTSSQTINGSTSIVMSTPFLSLDFISNGSNWLIR
jgi:hypothetical protein